MFPATPETTALAHLHDQARREARRLRREAVDDFWRGADAVWQRSQGFAQRSADRLKARLARHNHRSPATKSTTTKA